MKKQILPMAGRAQNVVRALVLLSVGLSVSACVTQPAADSPAQSVALHSDTVPAIAIATGVDLQELIGRTAPAAVQSERMSIALFRLEPGRASRWSYNRNGEEAFLIRSGRGAVWVGAQSHPVQAGSFILIPAGAVRSVRASNDEPLTLYAITSPAWQPGDDVAVPAPAGAPANLPD